MNFPITFKLFEMCYPKLSSLWRVGIRVPYLLLGIFFCGVAVAGDTVYVSRFWHDHQPIYWPDWNSNGTESNRVQYAWDSIILKNGQTYGTSAGHPDNDLSGIFGLSDRVGSYQSVPRNSLANITGAGGYAMSYSGSLIDNVRSLGGANQLGYGSGWNSGNKEARGWKTPSGSSRMEMVGFTYHHSLAPVLPKSVFRKELQIFKQAWWKAWGGKADLSDHSKGYFPTEMAFSSTMIDVLADEGYEWAIVASHHLSRTCPTYNDKANPAGTYNIYSSPPNGADQLGPNPTSGWWYNMPNPGQGSWNVSPFAYQLQKVKYVNPETGVEKTILVVPSDDTLSYMAGYSGAQLGMIAANIAPYAVDPNRPVIVLPATDGDNAWGGGSSSWFESTPAFFSASQVAGYQPTAIQDFVNQFGVNAPVTHIEDGAWIFPESDYGSPYFLKWVEPPVAATGSTSKYPGTMVDLETPGFALKFWSWAPVITGANWCETAEQMLKDEGTEVRPWVIQAPTDWNGASWSPAPHEVELAWHIYLAGLDSGFNYYGGLGNDDEVKPSLATRRAIEKLDTFVRSRLTADPSKDHTPPTVFKPQRFPWNPGGYTFGWFNSIPGGDTRYLKKMPSEFYVWTHAYDVSGITSVNLKVRLDLDGVNSMANHQNETYGGGTDVGNWTTISMTKRVLPKERSTLNAAANNTQIDYFITSPELADYYFAKITDANVVGFRGNLLDYYIEAIDTRGNLSKSDIQHVLVINDGVAQAPPAIPTRLTATVASSVQINLAWSTAVGATSYKIMRNGGLVGTTSSLFYADTGLSAQTAYTYTVQAANAYGDSSASASADATTPASPTLPSAPTGLTATVSASSVSLSWGIVSGATDYVVRRSGLILSTPTSTSFTESGLASSMSYGYTVQARNVAGESATASVIATTLMAPMAFAMNGTADFAKYLVSNSGMTIYAAIRGNLLYVATWSPGIAGNDHFILVTDQLLSSATATAPWAKVGFTADKGSDNVRYFLAAESSSAYISWFRWPTGAGAVAVSGTGYAAARGSADGTQMEGTIDLVQAFGSLPATIYVAALAYQTSDYSSSVINSGVLGGQAPAAVGTADNKVDPAEFLALPTASIRDSLANGTYDLLDPSRGFVVNRTEMTSSGFRITWAVVPGQKYLVEYMDDLGAGIWLALKTEVQATSGQAEITEYDQSSGLPIRRFYRIRLVQ